MSAFCLPRSSDGVGVVHSQSLFRNHFLSESCFFPVAGVYLLQLQSFLAIRAKIPCRYPMLEALGSNLPMVGSSASFLQKTVALLRKLCYHLPMLSQCWLERKYFMSGC